MSDSPNAGDRPDTAKRLAVAVDIATAAGELTLSYFRKGVAVETKSDNTPVTIADREAEMLIRSRLQQEFPGDSVLGEEHGFDERAGDTWVIDPIDGTRSFIAGVPIYAVLIACVAGRYDGTEAIPADRVRLGVIHIPALDETVSAGRGLGALWNDRPCSVSTHEMIRECRFGTSDFADLARREPALASAITRHASFSRTWGDAFGYLLVATGRLDAMVDPIVSPWDIAPLPVILEEAGGAYSDISGARVVSKSAVASNGRLHDELVAAASGALD